MSHFSLNDRWTFRDREPAVSRLRRTLRYNLAASLGLVVSIVVLAGLTYWLNLHYLIANLFAIVAGMAWNYAGSLYFTWAAKKAGYRPAGLLVASLGRSGGSSPQRKSGKTTSLIAYLLGPLSLPGVVGNPCSTRTEEGAKVSKAEMLTNIKPRRQRQDTCGDGRRLSGDRVLALAAVSVQEERRPGDRRPVEMA